MTVAITSLASGNSGSADYAMTSFNTASASPGANWLQLLAVVVDYDAAFATLPSCSVSGDGLTWVQIASYAYWPSGANFWNAVYLFRAMGASPTTGALTVTLGANPYNWAYSWTEATGMNTGGTNGSAAIVQSATNRATSNAIAATLAAFGSVANATYLCAGLGNDFGNAVTGTVGTGFTELHDTYPAGGYVGAYSEWRADNDTSPDATTTDPAGVEYWGAIAVEIADAPAGGQVYTRSATDGVFFLDPTRRDEALQRLDTTLLQDQLRRSLEDVRRDGLFPQDQAWREVLLRRFDSLSLQDEPRRLLEKLFRDQLLFGDSATLQTITAELTRAVTDGLYLVDARSGQVSLSRVDALLLPDSAIRNIARTLLDSLAFADARMSVVDRQLLEGLLLADSAWRALDRFLLDRLLLGDSAAINYEATAGVTLRLVADGLYLADQVLRRQEATVGDSVLLGDAAIRQHLKTLFDQVLFGDFTGTSRGMARTQSDGLYASDGLQRELGLSARDHLLVGDVLNRAIERLLREGLLMLDASSAQRFEALVQALVWAAIAAVDPVGLTAGMEPDMVGLTVDDESDMVGLSAAYQWPGPVQ